MLYLLTLQDLFQNDTSLCFSTHVIDFNSLSANKGELYDGYGLTLHLLLGKHNLFTRGSTSGLQPDFSNNKIKTLILNKEITVTKTFNSNEKHVE